MDIRIEGNTIIIRKLKRSDAQSIFQHAKHSDIARYTMIPHPYKLKDAEDFIKITHRKICKKESCELGIELKEIGQIIGMVGLMNIDYKNMNAEIGYWLGKEYWGKKIMKEAVFLILGFGFEQLKLVRIYARVMHPNIASAKLLEKQGFKYEGRLRKATLREDKWMDELRYSILRNEFKFK